jgi:hypothetical protein
MLRGGLLDLPFRPPVESFVTKLTQDLASPLLSGISSHQIAPTIFHHSNPFPHPLANLWELPQPSIQVISISLRHGFSSKS